MPRHSDLRPFACNHCDMHFARKDKLKQHEAKHVNHPLYQCGQCHKGFYRKEHLKDHEISKHSKRYIIILFSWPNLDIIVRRKDENVLCLLRFIKVLNKNESTGENAVGKMYL